MPSSHAAHTPALASLGWPEDGHGGATGTYTIAQ
jgi:hypothetical protein